jgi:starch synthase (maltosyl-transferring)
VDVKVGTRERVVIQRVGPSVLGGRHPAKAVQGRPVDVSADILADGHDLLSAVVTVTDPAGVSIETDLRQADSLPGEDPDPGTGNDRWLGVVTPSVLGLHTLLITAWVDQISTWRRGALLKAAVGALEDVDLAIGAELVRRHVKRARGADAAALRALAAALTDTDVPPAERVALTADQTVRALLRSTDPRAHRVRSASFALWVDRERAAFSTWYELFPRSASPEPGRHGTFRDVMDRLDHIAGMGFDVLYLPPIHPIGTTHRKGRNGAVAAEPGEPGSPWAIGSADGGHDAIHPALGSMQDLHALIAATHEHGMELALDIAFQCSPDHPWVREHPQWFRTRPDGSIQYAENPPKRYQDIYPLDFETDDAPALWQALRGVFEHWIGQGVRIFRVDNPHTKSLPFWEWCLATLRSEHPDCIFLAEAFTRPKVMYELSMRGFTQSYTYFTWRTHRSEIEDYYRELFHSDVAEHFRPNSWPNTPDILTPQLQQGGRPMYVQRLVLAATLTANYGMYGPAFELMWSEARPGVEEYLDNEKFELKHWDADSRKDSLADVIRTINDLRHRHPALQQDRTLHFHHVDNDRLIAYSKTDLDGEDRVLVVVNLDHEHTQAGTVHLDMGALRLPHDATLELSDGFGGGSYHWRGSANYVELDPHTHPAHVFTLRPIGSEVAS